MDVPLTWSLSSSFSTFFFFPSSFSLSIFFLSSSSCLSKSERERERITSFLIQPFIYDRSLRWKGLLTIKTSLFLTPPGSNYKSKEEEEEVIQFATSSWTETELSWILTNRKESFRWINMWWISSSFTPRKSNKLEREWSPVQRGFELKTHTLDERLQSGKKSIWFLFHLSFSFSFSQFLFLSQFLFISALILSVSLSFSPLEYLSSCLIACSWWWYSSSFSPLSTFITSSLPHSELSFFLSEGVSWDSSFSLPSRVFTPDFCETVSNLHCLNLLRWW